MITELHHIALIVSTEKIVDFYKTLGFKESFRKKRDCDTVVLLDGYQMILEIFIDNRHPIRHITDEPLGPRHFALKVSSPLEGELERLKVIFKEQIDHDLQIGVISKDWRNEDFVFLKDPDGNIVELHE